METPKEILQEQFSDVYKHLMAQGRKSRGEDGCAYRGEHGLKCAAGCRIPDDKYLPEIENTNWQAVCRDFSGMESFLDADLGQALQDVHDKFMPDCWHEKLTQVAQEFDLQVPQ